MTIHQVRDNFAQSLAENAYLNMCTVEEMKMAIEAMNKQIEQVPIAYDKHYYMCPSCKCDLGINNDDRYIYDIPEPKYCAECGQKLNWKG